MKAGCGPEPNNKVSADVMTRRSAIRSRSRGSRSAREHREVWRIWGERRGERRMGEEESVVEIRRDQKISTGVVERLGWRTGPAVWCRHGRLLSSGSS